MKNTLVGILVCGMMLATLLPVSALAITLSSDSGPATSGIVDRTFVRGLVVYKGTTNTGKTMKLYALRLHYSTISISGEHEAGVIRFRSIEIPTAINGYYGRHFIFASFWGSLNI